MGTRIDRDFEIKGLTIPLQVSSDSLQPLQITCRRVRLESKKLGLFRIGPALLARRIWAPTEHRPPEPLEG
jgi:hypothetical protein